MRKDVVVVHLLFLLLLTCSAHCAPLVAEIATSISEDLMSSDYTVTLSIGKHFRSQELSVDTSAQLSLVNCKLPPQRKIIRTILRFNSSISQSSASAASRSIRGVDVGCVGRTSAFSYPVAALAAGPAALPSQLATTAQLDSLAFAYCLASPDTGSGRLIFGQNSFTTSSSSSSVISSSSRIAMTFDQFQGYLLGMKGISLQQRDGKKSSNSSRIDTLMSATTRQTRVPHNLYKPLLAAFMRSVASRRMKRATAESFDVCYEMSSEQLRSSPPIYMFFEGGATWKVAPANYLVRIDKRVACFGIMDAGAPKAGAIIGTLQQEDNLIEFDIEERMLRVSGPLSEQGTDCRRMELAS